MTIAGTQAQPVGYRQPLEQEIEPFGQSGLGYGILGTAAGLDQGHVAEAPKDKLVKAPAMERKRTARKVASRVGNAESPHVALDQRTVSITLPLETYNWFEERAAKAPYEPSLAKYLQWELRDLEKAQRAEEKIPIIDKTR